MHRIQMVHNQHIYMRNNIRWDPIFINYETQAHSHIVVPKLRTPDTFGVWGLVTSDILHRCLYDLGMSQDQV
jgi:hypothetical protein